MKTVAALGVLAAIAAGALGTRASGVWGPDRGDREAIRPPRLSSGALVLGGKILPDRGIEGSACERLAGLAARLGQETIDPTAFIRRLGREAAGIDTGARALLDLARGGTDVLIGGGFRGPFSDGTAGQARHFAGIAVAASYGGADSTRALSIFVRRDPANSADGRLTDEAIAFERALHRHQLPTAAAGAWILGRICRRSGA
ncbi:MAG: hypothetical protein ACRDK5_11525 [Solirubrobacterales bacterium]